MSKYTAPSTVEAALEEAMPIIHYWVHKYTKNHYWLKDELYSRAYEGFMRAWDSYDSSRKTKFSTHAYTWVYALVKDFAKDEWNRMNTHQEFTIDRHDTDYYDLDINDIDFERHLDKLDGLEAEVFRLRMAGYTFEDIAEQLGISNLQKARKHYLAVEASFKERV